jgi:hypothetical protein
MSPIFNTFYNWKYRNMHLVIDPEFLRTQHCQLVKSDAGNVKREGEVCNHQRGE